MFDRIRGFCKGFYRGLTWKPTTPSWGSERLERVVIPDGPDGMEIHDPVAGIVHPHPSGACSSFVGDGRSTICAQCDWPEEAHGG